MVTMKVGKYIPCDKGPTIKVIGGISFTMNRTQLNLYYEHENGIAFMTYEEIKGAIPKDDPSEKETSRYYYYYNFKERVFYSFNYHTYYYSDIINIHRFQMTWYFNNRGLFVDCIFGVSNNRIYYAEMGRVVVEDWVGGRSKNTRIAEYEDQKFLVSKGKLMLVQCGCAVVYDGGESKVEIYEPYTQPCTCGISGGYFYVKVDRTVTVFDIDGNIAATIPDTPDGCGVTMFDGLVLCFNDKHAIGYSF